MRNVARAVVFVALVALAGSLGFFGAKVEAVTVPVKDSQKSIQLSNSFKDDNIESFDVKVEVEDDDGSKVAGAEKGSEAESAESAARSYRATAYCLKGKTASGRYVRRGMVAADPRVLRLGTRIHMSAGKYTGNYVVADTGGKIKGRILDIWVPSCSEARAWGRRTVKVKVVSKKKRR